MFGLAVGVLVAVFSYRWITNPDRGIERGIEERVVRAARMQVVALLGLASVEYVDALDPERAIGKTYVYPVAGGWEVSGYYRRDDRDAWLDLLMSTRVASALTPGALTVIRHYPASQAALARHCPANPRVADRFEVYAGSLELANGYVELTDADEQAARMDRDIARRQERGLPPVRRDNALLAALETGLPPCAGVALGAERLHMLAAGTDDIRDVITFDGEAT